MMRREIVSSNITSMGYDKDAKELEVEFKSGAVWAYSDVPEAEYQKLSEAYSIGSHFSRYIKDQFPGRKVS